MNSAPAAVALQPADAWQSQPAIAAPAAVTPTAVTPTAVTWSEISARRHRRPAAQRFGILAVVVAMQAAFFVALIKAGYVSVPQLPAAIMMVNIAPEPVAEKPVTLPPPVMQQPVVISLTPPPVEVASETAITLPPPPPPAAVPSDNRVEGSAVLAHYQMTLLQHLAHHKKYPPAARARRQQGVVLVGFTMDRTGRVLSASLQKSSRFEALDEEGVALMSRASPLPAPPPQVPGDPVSLVVPIEFDLR